MPSVSGTLRKLVLDGVSYDVPGDINVTFNRSGFEVEGQPTTGRTMHKMTRKVQTMESVNIMVDPQELEAISTLSEEIRDFPIAVELADGSVYRTTGKINFENMETETNKCSVTIIPSKSKDAWTPFLS